MRPLGVIGHLSRDVVAGAAPQPGGGPWHAARALRILRADALLFAKAGDREFGPRLAQLGLPPSLTVGGETTGFSFSYDADGVRTMRVDALGEPWSVGDLPQALLRRVGWLQVAPLLHGDFDEDALEWLARERRVLFDGQGLVRRRELGELVLDGTLDRSALRHVSILKLSTEEAAALGDDPRELGVPEVLVTHGVEGATVYAPDGVHEVPARRVDADPTGAGDGFAAGYLAARAHGHTPVSAARRATALVAAMLTGAGR
ncbi:MAG: carbohydrate kinase family protein [Actinomycetota bacterium]